LVDVVGYAERITEKGFVYMDAGLRPDLSD